MFGGTSSTEPNNFDPDPANRSDDATVQADADDVISGIAPDASVTQTAALLGMQPQDLDHLTTAVWAAAAQRQLVAAGLASAQRTTMLTAIQGAEARGMPFATDDDDVFVIPPGTSDYLRYYGAPRRPTWPSTTSTGDVEVAAHRLGPSAGS